MYISRTNKSPKAPFLQGHFQISILHFQKRVIIFPGNCSFLFLLLLTGIWDRFMLSLCAGDLALSLGQSGRVVKTLSVKSTVTLWNLREAEHGEYHILEPNCPHSDPTLLQAVRPQTSYLTSLCFTWEMGIVITAWLYGVVVIITWAKIVELVKIVSYLLLILTRCCLHGYIVLDKVAQLGAYQLICEVK